MLLALINYNLHNRVLTPIVCLRVQVSPKLTRMLNHGFVTTADG